MCEIILEVFKKELVYNTTNIVNLSSKTMKNLPWKKINGIMVFNITKIQNISDLNKFVELLTKRNVIVSTLKKDLDKEYNRNIDFINQLNNILKERKEVSK